MPKKLSRKNKVTMARRMRTKSEIQGRVPIWESAWWKARAAKIKKLAEKRNLRYPKNEA